MLVSSLFQNAWNMQAGRPASWLLCNLLKCNVLLFVPGCSLPTNENILSSFTSYNLLGVFNTENWAYGREINFQSLMEILLPFLWNKPSLNLIGQAFLILNIIQIYTFVQHVHTTTIPIHISLFFSSNCKEHQPPAAKSAQCICHQAFRLATARPWGFIYRIINLARLQ